MRTPLPPSPIECPLEGCNNVGNPYTDFLVVKNKRFNIRFMICRECMQAPVHQGTIGVK